MKLKASNRTIMSVVSEEINDEGRIRLSGEDRDTLWRACIIQGMLREINDKAARRVAAIEKGNWRLKIIIGHYEKFYKELLNTIPFGQLLSVQRQMDNLSYSVGVKNAGSKHNDKDNGLFLSNEQFSELIDACKDHCIVCALDKQEQRRCKLKKTLDSLPLIRDTVDANGNCIYLDALMQAGGEA